MNSTNRLDCHTIHHCNQRIDVQYAFRVHQKYISIVLVSYFKFLFATKKKFWESYFKNATYLGTLVIRFSMWTDKLNCTFCHNILNDFEWKYGDHVLNYFYFIIQIGKWIISLNVQAFKRCRIRCMIATFIIIRLVLR